MKAFAGMFRIFGTRSSLEMQRRSDSQYEGRKSNIMSLRQCYPASKNLLRFLQLTTELHCRFSLAAPRLKCSAMMVACRCVPASYRTWRTQSSPCTLPAGKPKSSPRMFMNSDRLGFKRMIQMLDRASVRSLFCMVGSAEKNDRWFMRESKPETDSGYITRPSGELLERLAGQSVGAYRLSCCIGGGVGLDGIRHLSKMMSVVSGFLHSVE